MTVNIEHPSGIYATVIADSVSERGKRLTTLEVNMHRFVLAEFNTHRVFSRNSASSRAIPFHKQLDMVMKDPAIPVEWPQEQSGMQGGDLLPARASSRTQQYWLDARDDAVEHAMRLKEMNVHKSIVNRILEPFLWHRVIVTATEWDGFFEQRCSPLAQPEIRVAAECMQVAMEKSTPLEVADGDFHLPYITDEDHVAVHYEDIGKGDLLAISAARCARVSYLTHDGKRDLSKDLDLYERLITADPPHWSPLEHVAFPSVAYREDTEGNFYGWHQLRHNLHILEAPDSKVNA